jgi:hypothetical protein
MELNMINKEPSAYFNKILKLKATRLLAGGFFIDFIF